MKQIDYCCPNITCHAFGPDHTYPVDVWKEGDIDDYHGEPILARDWGDPKYDDEIMCGRCPAQCVTVEELKESLTNLLKLYESL